jgi:hypothetical protein
LTSSSGPTDVVAVELTVTPDAAAYIADRGGRLYLWQEGVNAAWATDRQAFDDPGGEARFNAEWANGVAVMLADDLERPETLRIRLHRFRRHLRVEWDGAHWGWRGSATSGDLGAGG